MRWIAVLSVGFGAALAVQTDVALAYVGPGAGITMLGALWAVLAAVFMAIGFILYWPIRSLRRRRRRRQERSPAAPEAAADAASRGAGETRS